MKVTVSGGQDSGSQVLDDVLIDEANEDDQSLNLNDFVRNFLEYRREGEKEVLRLKSNFVLKIMQKNLIEDFTDSSKYSEKDVGEAFCAFWSSYKGFDKTRSLVELVKMDAFCKKTDMTLLNLAKNGASKTNTRNLARGILAFMRYPNQNHAHFALLPDALKVFNIMVENSADLNEQYDHEYEELGEQRWTEVVKRECSDPEKIVPAFCKVISRKLGLPRTINNVVRLNEEIKAFNKKCQRKDRIILNVYNDTTEKILKEIRNPTT